MARRYRDARGRPIVVVTGMGVVTSLGRGKEENWSKLVQGRSGIRPITRFPTEGLKTTIAGTVEPRAGGPYLAFELSSEIAECAAQEAIEQSGLCTEPRFPGPLFVATPPSEFEWALLMRLHADPAGSAERGYRALLKAARSGRYLEAARHLEFASIADRLQERFGTVGEPVSVCTACASGATAIQLGVESIRRGETEAVLAVGTDATVHPEGLVRFSLLSALSTANTQPERASKPFSRTRDGFVIAEGAGALVLESLESARSREARILGVVQGCGERADDYHRTRSKPDGAAMIGAITNALADAGVCSVDYINAHGTSTPENDRMECLAVRAVFGKQAQSIPISSNKSMVGHTLIAAGAVEAVFSLMTIETGVIPPTINFDDPDPDIPLDVVPNVARKASVETVLSNSFGFGGQNVALVLSSLDRAVS